MNEAADRTHATRTLAERQLEDARRDPRLSHGREAVVADWWAAMEAAERTRTVARLGTHLLTGALEIEEQRLGATRGDPEVPSRVAAALEAAWQRAELARAEEAAEFVELNAMTIVAMVGALDALVEMLVPRARELWAKMTTAQLMEKVGETEPEALAKLDEATLEKVREVLEGFVAERLPPTRRARGAGAERWEAVLRTAGLGARPGRELPEDLQQALQEVMALRNVLVHRAGRVDAAALRQAPTLGYREGDLARVSRADYRCYSAAIWTYGDEVVGRLLGSLATPPDLKHWRDNVTINA